MTRSPDLVLVDGSSYVYRAFHAAPAVARLTTARGEPTGAMLVVLNMLNKLLKDFQPARIAIVFDAPGRTFRDDLFAEYKAQRPGMPDELRAQVGPLLAMIQAQGLPLLREPGVEADDVIGTLACRAAHAGQQVLISTGDKDMAQLVNESITLINTMTDGRLDREGVKAKFDVYPEQIDRLPRAHRRQLRQHPRHREGRTEDRGEAPAAVRQPRQPRRPARQHPGQDRREPARRVSRRSSSRAALPPSVPTSTCTLSLEELTPKPPDVATLRELYTRYELRALLRALEGDGASAAGEAAAAAPPPGALPAPPAAPPAERRYETITRWEDFERWLARLEAAELFAFDTETTTPDYMRAEIVGVSFSVEPGVAAYVPLAHVYPGAPEQLARARVLGGAQAAARGRLARQDRPQPQVRRARAGARRHHARRHAFRHHARVVRVELGGDQPRPGRGRAALPGCHHHQLRAGRRQGRQADLLRPGDASNAPASTRPRTPT